MIASLGLSASASAQPASPASGGAEVKPIRRFTPERNMVELGVFGGVMIFNRSHDLYAPATTPGEPIRRPTADLGIRAAYFPLRFLGVEAELAALPAKYTAAASGPGGRGFIYGLRGHAILQLPLYRVVPFVLGGYGLMGVSSASTVAGKDMDPVGHLGGGVKYYLNRWVALRADVRGYIGAEARQWPGTVGHFETLLGVSVTLNRGKPKADPDPDHDGFRADDRCPTDPGVAPDGCPAQDSDGDGFKDPADKCPQEPGVAPDGCPAQDSDGDGFTDDVDKCPDVAGVAPDGCPPPDADGDGIPDKDDKCVQEPETRNGYEDTDGCPDEVPKSVTQYTGVIQGIYFDFNKDTIRKTSAPTLDAAAKIFQEFPDLRVEITGHADDLGSREYNIQLSERRAEAVKRYLVGKGVAAERIETRGVGPDAPIDNNKSETGRAKNRRIEFKILIK
ncbi:MAG TPA: OmpA family protein [Nannocystis sp.]